MDPQNRNASMLCAGNYDEYFGMSTDVEAVVYLMLMNTMIHDYFPTSITIGEDVSGMPTFCRSACCHLHQPAVSGAGDLGKDQPSRRYIASGLDTCKRLDISLHALGFL